MIGSLVRSLSILGPVSSTMCVFTLLVLYHLTATILCLLFAPYKFLVHLWVKLNRPNAESLSGISGMLAASLSVHRMPACNTSCYIVVDGEVSAKRLRALFENRILTLHRGEVRPYQKLEKFIFTFGGYSFMEPVQEFNLDDYVREWDYGDLILPPDCTEADIVKVTSEFLRKPWKAGMSPWEILVINGVSVNGEAQRKSVICCRLDHALADGYSWFRLLNCLFDDRDCAPSEDNTKSKEENSILRNVKASLQMLADATSGTLSMNAPVNEWSRTRTSMQYWTSLSPPVPVERVKSIKNRYHLDYFTLLLAALGKSMFRTYYEAGRDVPKFIELYFPLPGSKHTEALTNSTYIAGIVLRVLPHYSPEDLNILNKAVQKAKNSKTGKLLDFNLWFLEMIPSFLWATFRHFFSVDFMAVANFPVSRETFFLDGALVSDLWTATQWISPMPSIRFIVNMCGMNGKQRVHFLIEKNVFPDGETFQNIGAYFHEGINQFLVE